MAIFVSDKPIWFCAQFLMILYFKIQPILSLEKSNYITDNKQVEFRMIKAFGGYHDAKLWNFHYKEVQDSSWKPEFRSAIKDESNMGYFGFNKLLSTNISIRVEALTENNLNIYVNNDLEPLNNILQSETMMAFNKMNTLTPMKETIGSSIWLIRMPDKSNESTMAALLNRALTRYNTNVFCYTIVDNRTIEIYDVYKISINLNTILKKFGSWNIEQGLLVSDPDVWSRRVSLEGHHFRIVSAKSSPFVTYLEDNCTKKDCFKGVFADVLNALSIRMNFTYTIRSTNEWGSFLDGKWTGMVGMVQNGISDIAVADLTITKDRSTAVDFLHTLSEMNEELFIKNPTDSLSLDAYTQPLVPYSWLQVGIFFIVVPPILAVLVYFSNDINAKEFELSSCYKFVAHSFILRCGEVMPCSNPTRFAFGSVLIAGIIIYYHWEAALYSYLAVRTTNLPFRNLKELADTAQYKIIVIQGTVQLDSMRYSNDPSHIQVWNNKVDPMREDDSIKYLLKDSLSVLYADGGWVKYTQPYLDCRIVDTGLPVYSSQLAWTMQKQSPFYGSFNYHLNKLKEIGAVQRYAKKYEMEDQVCPDYSGKPLALKQCFTAFVILITGIIGCLIWLMLEICSPREWMNWFLTFGNKNFKKILLTANGIKT